MRQAESAKAEATRQRRLAKVLDQAARLIRAGYSKPRENAASRSCCE
ncbi:hypothetical protein GCM10025868_43360 [Angustibacter aerolatus]|uniref:Uncharacterized protein n=1 Tax=Angustibacter aerolatus TaxID=1162965 RepID=A0ABQ6JNF1_9ACTN|nr:hypothetical protein GCM10025868_43360 [Angustibacter aerolatus]